MFIATELRYYEILFIKLINQFFNIYQPDKLKTFIEMLAFISDASALSMGRAMQQVMANDPVIKINRDEYIVCLKLHSGLNDVQIRSIIRCSPNTIINASKAHKQGDLFIKNKMDVEQSMEVYKCMVKLKEVGNIF